jgi:hypothetical protein
MDSILQFNFCRPNHQSKPPNNPSTSTAPFFLLHLANDRAGKKKTKRKTSKFNFPFAEGAKPLAKGETREKSASPND